MTSIFSGGDDYSLCCWCCCAWAWSLQFYWKGWRFGMITHPRMYSYKRADCYMSKVAKVLENFSFRCTHTFANTSAVWQMQSGQATCPGWLSWRPGVRCAMPWPSIMIWTKQISHRQNLNPHILLLSALHVRMASGGYLLLFLPIFYETKNVQLQEGRGRFEKPGKIWRSAHPGPSSSSPLACSCWKPASRERDATVCRLLGGVIQVDVISSEKSPHVASPHRMHLVCSSFSFLW